MWGTLDEIVTKLGTIHPNLAGADLELLTTAFGRTRFVHLRRDDTAAQALSWVRAEQTHFWQDRDTALPGHEPRFDFDQIHTLTRPSTNTTQPGGSGSPRSISGRTSCAMKTWLPIRGRDPRHR